MPRHSNPKIAPARSGYTGLVGDIAGLLESARRASARAVNALMTATYWEVGHRIVEFEQGGKKRAGYGEELLKRLAEDLTERLGKGFSYRNLNKYRQFYLSRPVEKIRATTSLKSASPILPTASAESAANGPGGVLPTAAGDFAPTTLQPVAPLTFTLADVAKSFPLPWSHYVLLLTARSEEARSFYHAEALRGGWSVRQLRRQIDSQFYERTALSRNKAKMLARGAKAQPGDVVSADEARLRLCSSAEAPTARVVLSPGQRPGFAPHPQPEALKGRHNPCRNLSPGSKSMWSSARRTASVYWMNRSGPTSTRTWRPS